MNLRELKMVNKLVNRILDRRDEIDHLSRQEEGPKFEGLEHVSKEGSDQQQHSSIRRASSGSFRRPRTTSGDRSQSRNRSIGRRGRGEHDTESQNSSDEGVWSTDGQGLADQMRGRSRIRQAYSGH
ncbi:hypothetical protein T439DRAFT_175336 [Meredithblackwellia eburnea MCA 4105]